MRTFPARMGLACVLMLLAMKPLYAEDAAPLVGWLEISGEMLEGPVPLTRLDPESVPMELRTTIAQLDHVAQSAEHVGVVIYLDQPLMTLSQVDELAAALRRVREAGKTVLAFAEQYDLWAYRLAVEADTVLLQHKGELLLTGLAMEEMYLAGLLEKVGVQADLMQLGDYKGANETLTRTGPSDAWNENISAVLDDLYAQVIDRLAEARGMTPAEMEQAFAKAWWLTDEQLVEAGLVDELTDRDLVSATATRFGEAFVWDVDMGVSSAPFAMNNPFLALQQIFQRPSTTPTRPSLALIHAYGAVVSGELHGPARRVGPWSEEVIASRTIDQALADARDDELIKGVVLRIDSPGGSALASEMLWQSIRSCAAVKPVYVSIGSLAASGGYYLASAGDQVYLSPTSIVGSIGVVGGKLALGGLYEKLGITTHTRSRGPWGDLFRSDATFNPEQRDAMRKAFERVYTQFKERVSEGRGKRLPNVDPVAEGRLFTGRQAVTLGMADRLGGVERALTDLAHEVGLEAGAYDVIDMPPPPSLAEQLEAMFAPFGVQVREALDTRARRAVAPVMTGLLLLRTEPVLTVMPAALVVR